MKWLISGALLFVAVVVGLSIYLQPNDFSQCGQKPSTDSTQQCASADAIVVLSGGDTTARTAAGVQLYKDGWARTLVFTGAAQDKSGPSNAETMKQQAVNAGVPESAIILDENAADTQENARNTQVIISQHKFKTIILVTSGYHQRRANLEFSKWTAGTVTIKNHPVTGDKDWNPFWWLTLRGWWLAGGETAKIIAFYFGASS